MGWDLVVILVVPGVVGVACWWLPPRVGRPLSIASGLLTFVLALLQAGVGFFVFHAVNLKPRHPGAMVVLHQSMVLLISAAIVLQWHW